MTVPARIVVLGIGNSLLADEGIGPRAIDHLRQEPPLDGVRFIDGGTLGLALLDRIEGVEGLIVVDAARLGRAPGSVCRYEGAAIDDLLRGGLRTVHELGLKELLDMARLQGNLPPQRCLIAVEPARVDWATELSPEVSASLPQACALVRDTVAQWSTPVVSA